MKIMIALWSVIEDQDQLEDLKTHSIHISSRSALAQGQYQNIGHPICVISKTGNSNMMMMAGGHKPIEASLINGLLCVGGLSNCTVYTALEPPTLPTYVSYIPSI